MHPLVGEFLGTLVLVLLGDGVVANVLLSKTKGNNSGLIVIATGWGFAVMVGVFVAGAFGSADGYINPAVTLWSVMGSGDTSKLAMIPAQFAGGFVGAVLVWLHYLPHWKETQDQGAKLAVFCTGPAIRNTPANLMSEIIGTTVLLVGVGSIFAKFLLNLLLESGHILSACSCGELDFHLAEQLDMRSIQRVTLHQESHTQSCPFPAKVHQIGDMRGYQLSDHALRLHLRGHFSSLLHSLD